MNTTPTAPVPSSGVRSRAAIGTLLSGLVAAGWLWLILGERSRGSMWGGPGIAIPLVPFVYFSTELILGRTIPDLARRWDSLAGWQRGVIGTLLVLGILVAGLGVALLLAT